ncbi:MAG: hypothetical protein J5565_00225 [Muribaculaceae bacterium]|nr:hypothetical protein [Muribaculaceae bacterium]
MKENDIFTSTLDAVKNGAEVTVSLTDHSLAVDGKVLIDHGRWEGELGVAVTGEASALTMIEDAYASYESSVPEYAGNDHSRWFYARSEDELSDKELVMGQDRPLARCRLELLVLSFILNRSLTRCGPSMRGKWFWQSDKYPRLVILTEWLMDDSNKSNI